VTVPGGRMPGGDATGASWGAHPPKKITSIRATDQYRTVS
jgi:hypothetical protein